MLLVAILVAAGVGALVWWLPDTLDARDNQIGLVSRIVILVAVLGGAVMHFRGRLHHAALQAVAWLGVFAAVILGYSFRGELGELGNRLLGELVPHRAVAGADGSVAIRASSDGHFRVEVAVDGTKLRFMVDTGATGISLSRRDAGRLGIDRQQLRFTLPVQTANGTTYAAPVRLKAVSVGPLELRDGVAIVA
jgi:aspartyl protease family protein